MTEHLSLPWHNTPWATILESKGFYMYTLKVSLFKVDVLTFGEVY